MEHYLCHELLQVATFNLSRHVLAEMLVVVLLRVLLHLLHVLGHLQPSSRCVTVIRVTTAVITGNDSSSSSPVRQGRLAALGLAGVLGI